MKKALALVVVILAVFALPSFAQVTSNHVPLSVSMNVPESLSLSVDNSNLIIDSTSGNSNVVNVTASWNLVGHTGLWLYGTLEGAGLIGDAGQPAITSLQVDFDGILTAGATEHVATFVYGDGVSSDTKPFGVSLTSAVSGIAAGNYSGTIDLYAATI